MKTKYAIKVANTLFPKGTLLRPANLEEMRRIWPAIAPEPDSAQVGVWFPGVANPTIVEKSQLES
jgi:hypothetical protein